MNIVDCFSSNYSEARRKFRHAATAAGANLMSYHNPARPPDEATASALGWAIPIDGEPLSTDVAWLGPRHAPRLLVAQSGTHGVEGFCGSGIQIGWLRSGIHRDLAPDTAMLLIHAINPHGFAWLRRVNEDNVDLNRNFVEHDGDYPTNAGYEALKEAICPDQWTPAALAASEAAFAAYTASHGEMALQAAISSGQYSDPRGVFHGGRHATWSNQTLTEVLRHHASDARQVAVIDLHTGLGPYGVGEIMNNHNAGEAAFDRVNSWFGEQATSTEAGSSSSAPVFGDITNGFLRALPAAAVTAITLEYGTVPLKPVLDSVRADNWLHAHGGLGLPLARDIKARIRAAFYPDKDDWKQMVFDRAREVLGWSIRGLAQG
ncbi:MAG: M14 family metallopeptidase [Dongiaceae bacterium]